MPHMASKLTLFFTLPLNTSSGLIAHSIFILPLYASYGILTLFIFILPLYASYGLLAHSILKLHLYASYGLLTHSIFTLPLYASYGLLTHSIYSLPLFASYGLALLSFCVLCCSFSLVIFVCAILSMCSIHFHFQINVPISYSKIRVLFFSSVFRSALSVVLKQLLMKLLNIFLVGVFIFHVSLARRSTGLSSIRYYLISKLLDDDQMPRLLLFILATTSDALSLSKMRPGYPCELVSSSALFFNKLCLLKGLELISLS